MVRSYFTHDNWLEVQADKGVPVYRDCYIDDLRTIELGHWDLRDCDAAFVKFTDMEGITEARVQEIPPGGSLKPFKLGVDELVYVLQGTGFASVYGEISDVRRDFEWSTRSAFVIPRNAWCELRNMEGDRPVRLLHFNYLPLGMTVVTDPEFFFNNRAVNGSMIDRADGEFFSEAKDIVKEFGSAWGTVGAKVWRGNFWPDLLAWDKLTDMGNRGAGGSSVNMYVPGSEISAHMSVFPPLTYKKAHRHGPGRLIVIPGGEGFSVMWPEGGEKKLYPWHEGSALTPPNQWFHQHFNVGGMPARYFALHPPVQFIGKEEDEQGNAEGINIEYTEEDPWIRQVFEEELAKRGLTTGMPDAVYTDPDFRFSKAVTS
ncbi:MAG: cupin domain-containing protein [Dehalococcoidia bacterium]